MRISNNTENITRAKVAGIDYFRQCGYRTIAFFDNEPENLKAVGEADLQGEILLLHADTIFKTDATSMPQRVVKGKVYDMRKLVTHRRAYTHTGDDVLIDLDDNARRTA
jgi:hypothetical protein